MRESADLRSLLEEGAKGGAFRFSRIGKTEIGEAVKTVLFYSLAIVLLSASALADLAISKKGKLLLKEDFDGDALPELFTVGVGEWAIVDHTLRGRRLEADKHTAFRKIFLDHQDVIYQFDLKLEGNGYSQILINYDLSHLAKCVTKTDSVTLYKVYEGKKRRQMAKEGRDPGVDPMNGQWEEKTFPMDETKLELATGRWYQVTIEMVGERLSMLVDGVRVAGSHIGIAERKTNFGFQAGGLEGYAYYDNIRVWEAKRK